MQTQDAIIEIRRGLKLFRALEHAEGVMLALGAAEQNVREAQAAYAKLKAEIAATREKSDKETAEIEQRLSIARDRVRQQEAAAEDAGKARLAAAEERSQKIDTDANRRLAEANAELERVRVDRLAEESKRDAARDELAELTARIEQVRTEARRLIA